MNKIIILILAAAATLGAFACNASAQDTNYLKTDIGVFEARTGIVIVKGYGQVGSIALGTDEVVVRYKETTDAGSGQKIYGLTVQINRNSLPPERIFVDESEITSLLGGINYLLKITDDVTTLPAFETSYMTKAGLRVIANSVRREGTIQTFLQYNDLPRIALSSVQLSQFYSLIEQAKKNIDALQSAK